MGACTWNADSSSQMQKNVISYFEKWTTLVHGVRGKRRLLQRNDPPTKIQSGNRQNPDEKNAFQCRCHYQNNRFGHRDHNLLWCKVWTRPRCFRCVYTVRVEGGSERKEDKWGPQENCALTLTLPALSSVVSSAGPIMNGGTDPVSLTRLAA